MVDGSDHELVEAALVARSGGAVDRALAFLEADPRYFRSGYAKQRILRRLANLPMTGDERARACTLIVRYVDRGASGALREVRRVARRKADNAVRHALRDRLASDDPLVAWRALYVLDAVKHPGLKARDVANARAVIEAAAGSPSFPFVYPDTERLARRFWSSEWHAELVAHARSTRDLGARRLLDRARAKGWAGT